MHLGFPFRISNGDVARADEIRYVEELIEIILFTVKGERVNQPEFGCGIEHMVFWPIDSEVLAATVFLVQSELQRFLADLASIHTVDVSADEGMFDVSVTYSLLRSPVRRTAHYRR